MLLCPGCKHRAREPCLPGPCTYLGTFLLHALLPKSAVLRRLLRYHHHCLLQTQSWGFNHKKTPCGHSPSFLQRAPNLCGSDCSYLRLTALPVLPEDRVRFPAPTRQLAIISNPTCRVHPLASDTLFWLPQELHIHSTLTNKEKHPDRLKINKKGQLVFNTSS